MTNIIVKNYSHVNQSFGNWDTPHGKVVKNKDHYDRLMKEDNMVSYDKSNDNYKKSNRKEYVPSDKAREIIRQAKCGADRKGNIKLSDRTIDAMREIGAINKKVPSYMNIPKDGKSGFR